MIWLLHALAIFLVAAAMLPWIREGEWWIRVFDFPRLQLASLGVLLLFAYRFVDSGVLGWTMQAAIAAATACQLWRIRPFTPLVPHQVADADPDEAGRSRVKIMVANVLMSNRQDADLIALIRKHQPDLLLTVETDAWWEERLRAIEPDYPYTVRHPLPNTYGMLLFSRLQLIRPEVRFLVEDDVPSIFTAVVLPGCPNFRFYGVHPRPPRPEKRQDSTNRDAELVIIGDQVRDSKDPVIVAGDLNDVAWSYTTDLFQRLSGLLDPRRGRGMFNSFHAKIPLIRFPLDHVFHSAHFKLLDLRRLPGFGSDHFPLLIELSYERNAAHTQNTPEADEEDRALADEMVERAR